MVINESYMIIYVLRDVKLLNKTNLNARNEMINECDKFFHYLLAIDFRVLFIFLAVRRPKPTQSLRWRKPMQCSLSIDVVKPLILHQQLHNWMMQRRREENPCGKHALSQQSEQGAKCTRSTAQETTWVVTASYLKN